MNLSLVEKIGDIYVKREDLMDFHGINGGKGRVIDYLINQGIEQGYVDFVSCGSRESVQCEMLSAICENYDVNCYLFMPSGHDTPIITQIAKNSRTQIIRTDVGYVSTLKKQSMTYAEENNYFYIPFGLEDEISIKINKSQVQNIPDEVKRIVVPIGSGMNFISILKGLEEYDKKIPVLGVQIGLDPLKNIQKFLGTTTIPYEIVKTELSYNKQAKEYMLGNIKLNKTYEAKCLPYLKSNDLFWIIGKDLLKEQDENLNLPVSGIQQGEKKVMETNIQDIRFNDLTRDFIEDFISKMSHEEKLKLKAYLEANPRDTSSKTFMVVKSYIYQTYFKKSPITEKKKTLFTDSLNELLSFDEE